MQTRHLFEAIAAFASGPLLLAMIFEPAAPTLPGMPQAMPSAAENTAAIIAAGTSPAVAQSTPRRLTLRRVAEPCPALPVPA